MERIVLLNSKGVTLVEMMISLMITLIVSLALMQTTMVAMNANILNEMRDEAVSVAEGRMNELRSKAFTELAETAPEGVDQTAVHRKVRNSFVSFTPHITIRNSGAELKYVNVLVSWTHKGQTYKHDITSKIHKSSL